MTTLLPSSSASSVPQQKQYETQEPTDNSFSRRPRRESLDEKIQRSFKQSSLIAVDPQQQRWTNIGFKIFAACALVSRRKAVRGVQEAVILLLFLFGIVGVAYFNGYGDNDALNIPPIVGRINLFLTIATGILIVPIFVFGFPVIKSKGVITVISLDAIVWIADVAMTSIVHDDAEGEKNVALVSTKIFFSAVRLNTVVLTNMAIDSIMVDDDETSNVGKDQVAKDKDLEEEEESIVSTLRVALGMLSRGQELRTIATLFIILLGAMTTPAFNTMVGDIITKLEDNYFDDKSNIEFPARLAALGFLFLVSELLFYFVSYQAAKLIAQGSKRIQASLIDGVLYADESFEEKHSEGSLSNAFNAGVAKIQQAWDFLIFDFVHSFSKLIAAFIFLALVNFGFAVFIISALPFVMSFRSLERKALSHSEAADASLSHFLSRFQNAVELRPAARVNNAQSFVYERIQPALRTSETDTFLSWLWGKLVIAVFGTIGYSLNLITTIVFLVALSNGMIDSGQFFSLYTIVLGVLDPIDALGRFSGRLAYLSGAVHSVNRIMNDVENSTTNLHKDKDNCNESSKLSLSRDLLFDEVKFRYSLDSPLVLCGLTCTIPTGSYVAIMGRSGGGKSTLLSLLTGARCCSGGQIQMDGTDIGSVPVRSLRNTLGVVSQNTYVFDGTIRDNISFGCDVDMTDIVFAASNAGIHDFIESLPSKYETYIGRESNLQLSGGQLQRICGIARALVRKPILLLLDECTSALDPITERDFISTIEQLCKKQGLTIISVTHRVSTVDNADMILILDQGKVAESGTFHELVAGESSIFQELVSAGTSNHAHDDLVVISEVTVN